MQSWACGQCGNGNPDGANFCGRCGTPAVSPYEPTLMDYGHGTPTQMPAPAPQRDWGKILNYSLRIGLALGGIAFSLVAWEWMSAEMGALQDPIAPSVPPPLITKPPQPHSSGPSQQELALQAQAKKREQQEKEAQRAFLADCAQKIRQMDRSFLAIAQGVNVAPAGLLKHNETDVIAVREFRTRLDNYETGLSASVQRQGGFTFLATGLSQFTNALGHYRQATTSLEMYLVTGSTSSWADARNYRSRALAELEAIETLMK